MKNAYGVRFVPTSSTGTDINRNLIVAMALTTIVGLQIPLISTGLAGLAVVYFVLWISKKPTTLPVGFVFRLLLLVAFAAIYETRAAAFGFGSIEGAIAYGCLIPGLYGVGYAMGRNFRSSLQIMWLALSGAFGFVVFAFLSSSGAYSPGVATIEEYGKVAAGFWGGPLINRPGLGSMASLGICLIPSLMFISRRHTSNFRLLFLSLLSMAALGLYTNIILANRTPFLALVAAFLISGLLAMTGGSARFKLRIVATAAVSTIVLLMFSDAVIEYSSRLYIVTRFFEEGVDTAGRYDSWVAMLENLKNFQSGGRSAYIAGNTFVHNMWLDVAWDAGTEAFLMIVLFHLSQIPVIFSALGQNVPIIVRAVLLGLGTSIVTNFMQEPTMAASQVYFYFTCWLFGLILAMRSTKVYGVGSERSNPSRVRKNIAPIASRPGRAI
ncbi:MAG: hypothetical protein IH606_18360 [Burkholderiales bacterium]|nr:hypothetical protein [Burkholderiales bacterium]